MIRLLFIIAALLLSNSVKAQNNFDEKEIGWRGSDIALHVFHDPENKQYSVVLSEDDSLRVYVFNQNDSITSALAIQKQNGVMVSGGFISGSNIYVFCKSKSPFGMYNYTLNTVNGKSDEKYIPKEETKEETVSQFSNGKYYLQFSVNKKKSEFIVEKWTGLDSVVITRFPFPYTGIWDDITVSSAFSRDVDISTMDDAGLPDVTKSSNKRKLYLVNDTLFLLLNQNTGSTKVLTFDVIGKSLTVREIEHEKVKMMTKASYYG